MEFRHLTYFVAVAEDLHFRRAAERLHIAQPALSQQIARLEAELGVELLARTRRSVELTDAGRTLLRDARTLLERREQAIVAVRRAAQGQSGTLRVGFVGPVTYSILRTVVRAYRAEFPDVDLTLHELTSVEQIEWLFAGKLDIGFTRLPVNDDRLSTRHLLSESIVVVLPDDHPQAEHATVDLADLAGDPFIMVPRSREPTVFDCYVSMCAGAGFSPRIVQEAQQIHTIVELVAAGLGIALTPASLGNQQRPGVVYRPVSNPAGMTLQTGLTWRADEASVVVGGFIHSATAAVHAQAQ